MKLTDVRKIDAVNLELLAKQIVEGFISGMHKSPFHGFSVEFSEHKLYNTGESTRHVDWKLYAKTDKLYTKKYEEETNLRCHIVVDNSASMHYPDATNKDFDNLNKVGFSAFAAAALIEILKRQRDAVGLSVYSNDYDFYAPEKVMSAIESYCITNWPGCWRAVLPQLRIPIPICITLPIRFIGDL